MAHFVVTYESNLEIGQAIQLCECADAFIQVLPEYERDRYFIPFEATLNTIFEPRELETTENQNITWSTRKQNIGTYNLEVIPNIGATYHDYRHIPVEDIFNENVDFIGNQTAFVKLLISRKDSIIYDIPYNFFIEDEGMASADRPIYESGFLAALTNNTRNWLTYIDASAERFAVPRTLILAIAVMEATHGWYDEGAEWFGLNNSIRPMNINVDYWSILFDRSEMSDTAKNFDAGAFLLRRIIERLPANARTIRKIATLYNNINTISITDYGARVAYFTRILRPDWPQR